MIPVPVLCRFLMLALSGLILAGCTPIAESENDDRRNPDFLKGLSRKNGMDYKGAVEAFEAALVRNPRSAAAHLELGLLYEQQMNDYATAIYHYQKHLALYPESNVAEMLRARIESCKLELAKTVSLSLVPQQVQATLDRLTTENAALRQQIAQLQTQSIQSADAPQPNPSAGSTPPHAAVAANPRTAAIVRPVETPRPAARAHTVRRGENLYRIATHYGLKVADVTAANPGIDPNRLQEGQVIQIPPPRN